MQFTGAFDTVDHQILLEHVKHTFGVAVCMLDMVSSYKSGHTVRLLQWCHILCHSCTVWSAQGSSLFLLYAADAIMLVEWSWLTALAHVQWLTDVQHSAELMTYLADVINWVVAWISSNWLCLKTEVIWLCFSCWPTDPAGDHLVLHVSGTPYSQLIVFMTVELLLTKISQWSRT